MNFKKISLTLGMMAIAGTASAVQANPQQQQGCLWLPIIGEWCPPWTGGNNPTKAPEIDPASAMAGLTLLAGGLAVLRGRRFNKKND